MMKMNERDRQVAVLRNQAARYQSVGNGFMSQQLNAQIRRIANGLNLSSAKN